MNNIKDKLKIDQKMNNLKDKINEQLQKIVELDNKEYIFEIQKEKIYYMDWEIQKQDIIIQEIENKVIGNDKQNEFKVWNLSEYKYEIEIFNKRVVEHVNNGYPHPTLLQTLEIIKEIVVWISSDPHHKAIIHCQESRGRSMMVLSCLLSVLKVLHHPFEALQYLSQILHVKEETLIFQSQLQYLKNFANFQTNLKLNTSQTKLIKIIINKVPILKRIQGQTDRKLNGDDNVRMYLQIFQNQQILFNSLNSNQIPDKQGPYDDSVQFDVGLIIQGDVLIRIKHFENNHIRYPMFRFMLNSGFIFDNVLRVYPNSIDSANNLITHPNFFIDFFFQIDNEIQDKTQSQQLHYILNQCQHILTQENHHINNNYSINLENVIKQAHQNDFIIEDKSSSSSNQQLSIIQSSSQLNSISSEQDFKEQIYLKKQSDDQIENLINDNDIDKEIENDEDLDNYIKNLENN